MSETNMKPTLIDTLRTLANNRLERLRLSLFEHAAKVLNEVRARWPEWRERAVEMSRRAREALQPDEIRRRWEYARTWAMLHDTVPPEATARLRERWIDRQQRREKQEAERRLREEEQAKKREKKEEEERQAYSVYFE